MKNEYKVGLFFIIALILLLGMFDLVGKTPLFSRENTYVTYFTNISQLKKGDIVKLEGVDVGKVSSIELSQGKIKVTIAVKRGTPVKSDSVASIRLTSLLGTSYVNLSFGSDESPLARNNDIIQSEDPVDLNKIMAKIESAITSMDSALGVFSGIGEGDDEILKNLNEIIADIANGKGTLGKLVKDETLYNELTGAFSNINELTAKLNAKDGSIGKLMHDERLYNEATLAATNLNSILEKINSGKGTLGKLVNDDSLYIDAKNAAIRVERGVDTLEDLAPLRTVGSIIGIASFF